MVRYSGGTDIKAAVPPSSALVVATPGAEPLVEGGYAATVLLDAWASLSHSGLEAGEQALLRWMQAAVLTRPRAEGGRVVLAGVPDSPALTPVEGLVRWDPEWFAVREVEDRRGLDLPPLAWTASATGAFGALADALESSAGALREAGARVLGPRPLTGRDTGEELPAAERPSVALVSCAPGAAAAVAHVLRTLVVTGAARRDPQISVRVGVPEEP